MKRENIVIAIFACSIISLLIGNSIMLLNISNRYDPDRQKMLRVWIVNQTNDNDEYVKLHKYNVLNLTDIGLAQDNPNINLTDYSILNQFIQAVDGSYLIFEIMGLSESQTYEIRQPFGFDYKFNETKQITASMMVVEGNWLSLSYSGELEVLWVLIGNEW